MVPKSSSINYCCYDEKQSSGKQLVGSCARLAFVAHAYEGEPFFMDQGSMQYMVRVWLLGMRPEELQYYMGKYEVQRPKK